MNDYNHPSSTIYTQSSSYFTNPNMASMPATLSWQHSVGNMVNLEEEVLEIIAAEPSGVLEALHDN
ncbi:hypothetical protein YQE_09376, partial [Dendroctonus ponderosae]